MSRSLLMRVGIFFEAVLPFNGGEVIPVTDWAMFTTFCSCFHHENNFSSQCQPALVTAVPTMLAMGTKGEFTANKWGGG